MADLPKHESIFSLDLTLPLKLNATNFTSVRRTPWAGQLLAKGIKSRFVLHAEQRIGESWEVSCDPDAPSRIDANPTLTLSEVIAARTIECLSEEFVKLGRTTCEILIKLLNASSPLSLQIHPSDDNPQLKANECGKPESWLVLSAEPGCGLYLGFRNNISKEEIESKLLSGAFDSKLLQFVPVSSGDYFEINPHVPHAIGSGIVLLEPQRIIAGKSGKTWRLWDWNRKYNAEGIEDPVNGTGRELHVKESMPLLDPSKQHGESYVNSLRRHPKILRFSENSQAKIYPANQWYQTIVVVLNDQKTFKVLEIAKFLCVTVLQGSLKAMNATKNSVVLNQGESFFVGSIGLPIEWASESAKTIVSIIIPAGAGVEPHEGLIFKF